jgi:hypothetical protein
MRSCRASAYEQWLQVKTTSVVGPPASEWVTPSVSGSEKLGASMPSARLIRPS